MKIDVPQFVAFLAAPIAVRPWTHHKPVGDARILAAGPSMDFERPEKTLYFTTGHGERSLDASGPQDYGTIKQKLTTDNPDVKAAVQAVRTHKPAGVVVAVPVGAAETCREFAHVADEVVKLARACGGW